MALIQRCITNSYFSLSCPRCCNLFEIKKKKLVEKLSTKRDKFGLLVHWRLDRQLQTREQENNIVIITANKILFYFKWFHFNCK